MNKSVEIVVQGNVDFEISETAEINVKNISNHSMKVKLLIFLNFGIFIELEILDT